MAPPHGQRTTGVVTVPVPLLSSPTDPDVPDPATPMIGTGPDPAAPISGTGPDPAAPISGTGPDPAASISRTELNFHRLVHYQASLLWTLGEGEHVVSVLSDLVANAVGGHPKLRRTA
jgi:hypothetical protein